MGKEIIHDKGVSSSYKLSFYNIRFILEGKEYLWNTLTGACICLDRKGSEYLKDFKGEEDNTQYFEILQKNGCITDSNINEFEKIIYEEKYILNNEFPNRLSFTIAPGLGCNYKCVYCFEDGNLNNKYMSEEVVEKTISYILSRIEQNNNLKYLSITWFGGEPLLYMQIIDRISSAVIECCDKNGVLYKAGIITNGRFLTRQNVELLKKCQVKQAQVSIDGPSDIYCKLKKAKINDYTSVIQNVKIASEFIRITVRINIDEFTDVANMYKVIETIMNSGINKNISFYPGFVRNYSRDNDLEQHAHSVHVEHEKLLYKYLEENYGVNFYNSPYPKRRKVSCLQVCRANVCIGPEGELYRCEHYFGDISKVIGDVDNGFYNNSVDDRYYNVEKKRICKECKYFPLCMGGCLDDVVSGHFSIDCSSFKKGMLEMQQHKLKHISN